MQKLLLEIISPGSVGKDAGVTVDGHPRPEIIEQRLFGTFDSLSNGGTPKPKRSQIPVRNQLRPRVTDANKNGHPQNKAPKAQTKTTQFSENTLGGILISLLEMHLLVSVSRLGG